MAPILSASRDQPAPTRPRLQSVNQDFSDLNEQIRQIAHIIRLPDNWATVEDQVARSSAVQHVVRARAEWVLRWTLDKLKDDSDAGTEARANATTWQLLECMIHILPVSRSANHLRDAGFTTILEKALVENFDKDIGSPADREHTRGVSDSSETIYDDAQPSKKRKRGSPGTSPSKRAALGSADPALLFRVIRTTLRSITGHPNGTTKMDDTTQAELMKMVLRTESPQAARVLKFWLLAVRKLVARAPETDTAVQSADSLLDLSVVLEIWELRILDAADITGSSSESFANECLVPTLQLVEQLKTRHTLITGQNSSRAIDSASQALDKLLTRHLLAPERTAFFSAAHDEKAKEEVVPDEASALSDSLGPLRAMLLQAAQIEDTGETVPDHLASAFTAVIHLLDLAIRASPSKTPKSRIAERPWIQAVFLSLADSVGCSLKTPPDLATPKLAVAALQSALEVLRSHNVTIEARILKSLFWYHSGIKYPLQGNREIQWSLIASLIQLDASVFVNESRSLSKESDGLPVDLTEYLFDQISDAESNRQSFVDHKVSSESDKMDIDSVPAETQSSEIRVLVLGIVTALMSAYSKNRNLLGFLRRWDDQLVKSFKSSNRKALEEKTVSIWEDRIVTRALADLFEQSLTQGQIVTLVEDHADRLEALDAEVKSKTDEVISIRKLTAYKSASSSAIIIPAVLESIKSDETLNALQTQLHSLFKAYTSRVQDVRYSASTRVDLSWITICLLTAKLWPIDMHNSLRSQQSILYPLLDQAKKDMSTGRKDPTGRKIDSAARAAAMLFIFDACDRLQTLPGSEKQVQDGLNKAVKNLSSSRLEDLEYKKMVEIFCANFVQLLGHLDLKTVQESMLAMFGRVSAFSDDEVEHISGSLAQAVLSKGNSTLHNAYASALSDALDQSDDSRLHHVALQGLVHIHPSALSRERREAILDRMSRLMIEGSSAAVELLCAMVQLMAIPNASAKISTDGTIIFEIAAQLQQRGTPARIELQQLQLLTQKVLGHIFPNQKQAQSRAFLGDYQKKLNTLTDKNKKVSTTGLAILRATILEQKDSELLSLKQYITLLKQCLTDDGNVSDDVADFQDVLDAFDELASALLSDPALLKTTTTWLRTWIKDNADLNTYITSTQANSVEVAEYVARLHKLVGKYRLFPDVNWLIALTVKILCGPLDFEMKRSALATVTEVLIPLEIADKLSLISLLTEADDLEARPASYSILRNLISTLPDRVSNDPILKQKQLAILPKVCSLLLENSDAVCFNALMDSIDTILNSKASLASQHSIECVLGVLVKLTSRTSPALSASYASHIYTRLCETSRLILLIHRGRLGGRSHILLPLLQGLLFCLFTPTSARSGALPTWLRSNTPTEPIHLTPTEAAHYTRVLSTLCNPPQSSISKSHQNSRKSKDLNDPVKAAREKTSSFLYPLLSSFCRFQLSGRLRPDVRAKLMPGIWEVVGTASLKKEVLDAMFAGLSRSERDVWRGVWGEWESVFGRKERFVDGVDV
ncbi:Urb2/Npa2 family-domain-containing protein [Phaeosphaeria sp. MPI-PUGE-AT-0046c]|nr:Urb2/Npa2 family-domain-containing protein [Phaeosphaeria sp. MPI-PUGE-AT-0046c]